MGGYVPGTLTATRCPETARERLTGRRTDRKPLEGSTPMRLLLVLALPVFLAQAGAATLPTDNQKLMKVDLMVVTAHPDDESMCAATMARLSLDGGKTVALVTATRGET